MKQMMRTIRNHPRRQREASLSDDEKRSRIADASTRIRRTAATAEEVAARTDEGTFMKNGNLSAQSPSKTLIAIFVVIVIATTAACVYGCAPKETSEQATAQSDEEAPVMQGDFSFSADSDCATCHETEGGSMTDGNCPAANHAAQSCIDCHTDIDGLTSVHDGVAYGDKTAKRLKKTVVDEATCLTDVCHGSYEALAEKTASSTILTDNGGTTVNPHDMPVNEDHETIDCGSCHDMHASDDIAKTAQKACQSCHHMGTYECYSCHE